MKVVVVGNTNRDLFEISNLLKSEDSHHSKEDSASQWIGEISKARILDDNDPDFQRKLTDANPNVAIIVLDSEKKHIRKSKQLIKEIRKQIPGIIVVSLVNPVESEESIPIEMVESLLGVTCYEFPKMKE